jgi:hypothetical protein
LFQRLFGIARLQNLAGERPLLLAEVGLDSQQNGKVGQAQALRWLIQGAFCIGLRWSLRFWVDRRVVPRRIRDSGLGFRPDAPRPARVKPLWKPCARYLGRGRSPAARNWPSISVVVCSYNGHRTIRDTLEGLATLRYPAFEVIVVDDGSSPPLEPLVAPYGFRTIRTLNRGLSAAPQHWTGGSRGRDRRVLGRRRLPGPGLAYVFGRFIFDERGWSLGAGGDHFRGAGHGAKGPRDLAASTSRRPGCAGGECFARQAGAGLEGPRFIDGACCGNGLCLVLLLPQNWRKGGPETCPYPWCGRRVVAASPSLLKVK